MATRTTSALITLLLMGSVVACGGGAEDAAGRSGSSPMAAAVETAEQEDDETAVEATDSRTAAVPLARARPITFDPAHCRSQQDAPHNQTLGLEGYKVMVTSADRKASEAGCKVMAAGGTAIDAAIAVQAVLGVVEPFASGLAGGSLITYYDARTRKTHVFDGLAAAPANTGGTPDIYKAVAQDVSTTPPYNVCKANLTAGASISSQQGNTNISARAAAVPGTLKVLDMVHKTHGKRPWNSLWDDAIQAADSGFPMTKYMYSTLYSEAADFDEEGNATRPAAGVNAWSNSAGTVKGAPRCKYPDIRARYCDATDATQQRPKAIGTTIQNPQLAATMRLVRDGGADAFYAPTGPIASAIVTKLTTGQLPCKSILPNSGTPQAPSIAGTIAAIPSLMTTADFATYKAIERKPLVGKRFGMTIHTQPAPSFGGVVTLYSLDLLERKFAQGGKPAFLDTRFLHLATEASRLANADRRALIGDPAYSNVNERVAALLSPAYLNQRAGLMTGTALGSVPVGGLAEGIPAFQATDPLAYVPLAAARGATLLAQRGGEDWNTTSHLSVIDAYGNALSMTTTINTHWGAHIEAAGMLINNGMSNFSAAMPGLDVNGYAAHKRPRSSIAPAIAFDARGRLSLVWGAAGGGPIPDYIVKTFLGHKVYERSLQRTMNAPNWTGQNGIAQLESGSEIAGDVPALIGNYGNTEANAQVTGLTSGLSGISVKRPGSKRYVGAADRRRNGAAVGY
jgi:gamma-glutamyltranspeptidase/glutathione hydrolase